jgi:lipopolysaccharide assembly protein A
MVRSYERVSLRASAVSPLNLNTFGGEVMRFIQAVLLLVFLGVIGVFAAQNTQVVSLRFLNWGVESPIAIMSIAIYLLGMLSGWTVVGFMSRSLRDVTNRREL